MKKKLTLREWLPFLDLHHANFYCFKKNYGLRVETTILTFSCKLLTYCVKWNIFNFAKNNDLLCGLLLHHGQLLVDWICSFEAVKLLTFSKTIFL